MKDVDIEEPTSFLDHVHLVSYPHVVVFMMIERSCVLDVEDRTTFHRHVAQGGARFVP